MHIRKKSLHNQLHLKNFPQKKDESRFPNFRVIHLINTAYKILLCLITSRDKTATAKCKQQIIEDLLQVHFLHHGTCHLHLTPDCSLHKPPIFRQFLNLNTWQFPSNCYLEDLERLSEGLGVSTAT